MHNFFEFVALFNSTFNSTYDTLLKLLVLDNPQLFTHLPDHPLPFLQWADCETACRLVAEFPDMQQLLKKFQSDLSDVDEN